MNSFTRLTSPSWTPPNERATGSSNPPTPLEPLNALLNKLRSAKSEGAARIIARDFYHAAAITGIPSVRYGSATFLYHANNARNVLVAGEFNGWNATRDTMAPIGQTGLFIHHRPAQAGLKYKFVVDGRWQPDPANPLVGNDGHGGLNSVLSENEQGRLRRHPAFYSRNLRNRRPITVHLPRGYEGTSGSFPVVYVMDGLENLERAKLPTLFDEAQSSGYLPPFITVFIPHIGRRRHHEYTPYFRHSRHSAFHRFVALEIVPYIDLHFRTLRQKQGRTLIGQSFGGTAVASLGAVGSSIFQHIIAQSGVYVWGRRQLTTLFERHPKPDIRIYLDCVANPAETFQSQILSNVLRRHGIPHFFRAIASRHEYEDWRDRLSEALRYVWFGIHP